MAPTLLDNELEYLVSVWASEESGFGELIQESNDRGIALDRVEVVLIDFLNLGEIGVGSFQKPSGEQEFSKEHALEIISNLNATYEWFDPILFLTEKGWKHYDNDTWGITVKRAREILFSANSSSNVRIPAKGD